MKGLTENGSSLSYSTSRAVLLLGSCGARAEATGASAEELRRVTGYSLSTTVIRALDDLRRQSLVRVVTIHRGSCFRAESHIWALTPKGVKVLYLIRGEGSSDEVNSVDVS